MTELVFPENIDTGTAMDADEVQDNFDAIKSIVNGQLQGGTSADGNLAALGITARELEAALAAILGVSQTDAVRRGKSVIATEQARTNTAYGLLTTPDQVSSVVLPTDGEIHIAYQAQWKESVSGAARAAIFIGATQIKLAQSGEAGGPVTQAAALSTGASSVNVYQPLASGQAGLGSQVTSATPAAGDDVTTGQVIGMLPMTAFAVTHEIGGTVRAIATNMPIGGELVVFAAAGTYDISVQFKASSGSVTAKNRKLWVKAEGF